MDGTGMSGDRCLPVLEPGQAVQAVPSPGVSTWDKEVPAGRQQGRQHRGRGSPRGRQEVHAQ